MPNVPSHDARRRVSRLPFLIADLALLAAVLVLVLLSGRPLDPLVAGLAVLGAIAAAVLGVTPWVIESWASLVRRGGELQDAVDSVFELQGNLLEDLRARSRSLHDLVDKHRAADAGPAWAPLAMEIDRLREELGALDERFAERVDEVLTAQAKAAAEAQGKATGDLATLLGKRVGNLGDSVAALRESLQGAGAATEGIVGELSLLREELGSLGARIDLLAGRVEALSAAAERAASGPLPDDGEPRLARPETPAPASVDDLPAAPSVPAVEEPPPAPPPLAEAPVAPAPGTEPGQVDEQAEPEGWPEEPAPAQAPRKPRKAKPAPPPEPTLFDLGQPAAEAAPPRLLPESGELQRTPGAEGAGIRLVAHVMIGAGDFPYVRGEGGGLRPERGTPLRFVEIGLWEWRCERADGPVTLRLFRNDRDPAYEEAQVVMPGERLDWAPSGFEAAPE